MTAPLVVFPFRYRDPRTKRWVKARHEAERAHQPAPRRVLADGDAWDLHAWDAPPDDPNGRYAAWAHFGEPLEVANMRRAQPIHAILAHLDLDAWSEVPD